MAVYKVKVLGACTGGEHISLSLRRDGAEVKKHTVTRTEILQDETIFDEALIFFLRMAIKKAGATTLAQAKAAVESAEWVI